MSDISWTCVKFSKKVGTHFVTLPLYEDKNVRLPVCQNEQIAHWEGE